MSLPPRHYFSSLLVAFAISTTALQPVESAPVRDGAVGAELIAEPTSIAPGKPFTVALRLEIDPTWHTYWINPGDAGYPTKIKWELPEGFTASDIQFPYPHRFVVDSGGFKQVGLGYITEAIHLIEITPPANLPVGKPISLGGKVDWLMCDDAQCVAGGVTLRLSIDVTPEVGPPADPELFAKARAELPADAPTWTVSAAEVGERNLTFTVTPPSDAKLPDPGSLVLYPEAGGLIDLTVPAHFEQRDGKLVLTLPKGPYFQELPSPIAAALISDAGFSDFDGRHALRLTDAPAVASSSPATVADTANDAVSNSTDSPVNDRSNEVSDDGPFGGGLLGYLLAGFIGGMILNIMPCVFPVISLKILSFVSHAGDERRKVFLHGAAYTFGILLFFIGLAAIVIALKIGWGGQFQSPIFVMIMTAVIVVLSLSLFGVFEFGLKMTSVGGNLTQASGYGGSFWSGALAVILATPCTGPFLGTSLGWALSQPAAVILIFFTMMGLGMAAPYVLLTAFPALTRRLPRPGPWMETFKQVMGFPMLGAAVFLLWILEGQIGETGQAFFMGALILLGLAAWAWGRFGGPAASGKTKNAGMVTIVAALIGAMILSAFATKQTSAVETSDSRPIAEIIEGHRKAGKHVFVDFTARWCAICQTNKPAMHSDETAAAFAANGVEFVIADWTNKNDDIYQFLKKYGRRSVPYYPLFPADLSKGPIELPQNLTNGIILDHVEKLADIEANFPPAKN